MDSASDKVAIILLKSRQECGSLLGHGQQRPII
jgi:hypothetical protein